MASCAAAGANGITDLTANSVAAMASDTVAFGIWFSCLMSGRDENGSGCVRHAIEQTEQHVACSIVVCDSVSFAPNVHGASASEACGAANIFDALWPTPGNSTRRQLKAQPRACASFRAAWNTFTPR